MVYRDKKGIVKYSIFCVIWAAMTGLIWGMGNLRTVFLDYCLGYWCGFSGLGTALFWWILVQFPIYGGSIFYYQKWRMYSRYILLKKGLMKAEKFFVLQIIKMTGIYYGIHFIVTFLVWSAGNGIFSGYLPSEGFYGFIDVVMLYFLLFLNGLAFFFMETVLYTVIHNEYFSFVIVLFAHILVNLFSANLDKLPPCLWTVCGNLAVCGVIRWQGFVISAAWIAVSGCLLSVFMYVKREEFWG